MNAFGAKRKVQEAKKELTDDEKFVAQLAKDVDIVEGVYLIRFAIAGPGIHDIASSFSIWPTKTCRAPA